MASTTGKPLDAEWTRWLHLNIQRGCAIDELRGILRSNGFSDASIEAGIKSAGKEVPGHVPMPVIVPEIPRPNLQLPNAVAQGGKKAQLYTVDDFLSREECEEVVALIRTQLRPSTISTPPGGEYDKAFRTSRTCDLSDTIPAIARLDTKIAEAVGFARSMAEPTQGQHYEIGQVFKTHTDFFKPYELEKYVIGDLGQRTWTFMIYLNDPQGGGETEFPDLGMKVSRQLCGFDVACLPLAFTQRLLFQVNQQHVSHGWPPCVSRTASVGIDTLSQFIYSWVCSVMQTSLLTRFIAPIGAASSRP